MTQNAPTGRKMKGYSMPLFKLGKTHVPHRKNTADSMPVRMPPPAEVLIPTVMHIGAPATPIVAEGEPVFVGQKIAEAGGYVSAPIHASVSGTVKGIESIMRSDGRTVPAIRIESDGNMTPYKDLSVPAVTDFDSFSAAVRESGAVGLGGAGFPTSVKLDGERKGLIRTVIINGAECEPYITSDTQTMLHDGADIYDGMMLLKRFIRAEEFIIGVESNKQECINKLRLLFAEEESHDVKVVALPSTYPQGGEKILIYNLTGREVPEGKLPADAGCLVMNVTTLAFLGKYFRTGMPLVEKCVTVDGSAVLHPKNVIAPIGTPIEDVLAFAGGISDDVGKLLYGGPMMGIALHSIKDPILKTTNAVTVLNAKDALPKPTTPCIHCGRCVSACPMRLNPTQFSKALRLPSDEMVALLSEEKLGLCIECGCCSFVCPAGRPLVENNRIGKAKFKAALAANPVATGTAVKK